MKRPSFQFYPGDWQRDAGLRLCSVGARGCWIEMLCVMHQAEPYGHLRVNGLAITAQQLSRMIGATSKEVNAWLDELEGAGVFTRDADGGIVSRRMVRDEEVRNARANGGKEGAKHGFKGAEHGKKGGRPRKETGDKKPPFNPPPSSSSSSSSSNNSVPNGTGAEAPEPPSAVDLIFANGVPLLVSAGLSDKQARTMLGMFRKQHADDAIVSAIQQCVDDQAIEPVGYLQRVLRSKPKPQQRAPSSQSARNEAYMNRLFDSPQAETKDMGVIDASTGQFVA